MNLLKNLNLNQLADYVFIGGTILGFVLFIGLIGVIGKISKDISKLRRSNELNQELALSQVKILKQLRDQR